MIKSLYIHIPFCSNKCPYCDFTSIVYLDNNLYRRYVEGLKRELTFYSDLEFSIETIYFGGGTPSILKPELIGEVINFIKDNFNTERNLEITIEVNPEDYNLEDFYKLKSFGVNRVSIGNQSFLRKNLISLGRVHNPISTLKAIQNSIYAGIKNINLDLIFGIENQTLEDLEIDLEIYTDLPITHISAYLLTAYEETPLGQLVKQKKYKLPDEKIQRDMYIFINSYLEDRGFYRYELSNWSRKNYQCKHNLSYWELKEFLGIGVSSWSFIKNTHFGNTKNIFEYLNKVENFVKPISFRDVLTEEDLKFEKVMLGLRLSKGVELNLLKGKKEAIDVLVNSGFAEIRDNKLRLTPDGLIISNFIINKLTC